MAYGNEEIPYPRHDTARGHRFERECKWISCPCKVCGYGIEEHDEWPEWHQTESGMWYRQTPVSRHIAER